MLGAIALVAAALILLVAAVQPPAADAQAGSGRIEGTVTDATTGDPIEGIEVCATSFVHVGCNANTTDLTGRYEIDGLPTGNYVVDFIDVDNRYARACFGSGTCNSPQRVGLVSPQTRSGIDARLSLMFPTATPTPFGSSVPTPTATVTPTPTSTTVPLPQATPTATPTAGPPPGSTPTPTSTAAPTPTATAAPPVTPSPTPTLRAGEATISGTITVLSNGDPVFGARVCAVLTFPALEQCVFSTLDGTYRITGLSAGNYAVQVSDPSQRFVASCWGSQACETPQLRGTQARDLAVGVDIAMDPLFSASFPSPTPEPPVAAGSISGRISVDGVPTGSIEVCAFDLPDLLFGGCTETGPDGTYEVIGLRTANYAVFAEGPFTDFDEDYYVCYPSDLLCFYPVPVGVVDPYGRVGINIDVESGLTFEEVFELVPTPTAVPSATPTPEPTLEPLPPDAWPIPYESRQNSPWADVPHFGIDGIGTYALGTYPFASPGGPIIDHLNGYYGETGVVRDDGSVTWGADDNPAVTIGLDANGLLASFDVDLEAVSSQGLGLFVIGEYWLRDSPITVDAYGLASDRLIYLEDDEDGLAVRCGVQLFCLHQSVERAADGSVTAFGPALRMTADAGSIERVRINDHVTAAGLVPTRDQPGFNTPVTDEIDLSGSVTAGVVGQPFVDGIDTTWVRLTPARDPLRPTVWVRLADVAPGTPVGDAEGPLPRLAHRPDDLATIIGETHTDPLADAFDAGMAGTVLELMGQDGTRAGWGVSSVSVGDRELALTRSPADLGASTDLVLSENLDGAWTVVDAWSIRLGTNHLNMSAGTPQCPFLAGGNPNLAELVVDTDYRGVAGWIWVEDDFVPTDATQITCEKYR